MSWHVLKLDLNSARWMPKLVSYAALTSQSLRATSGPLQDNWSLFHYVIGILGILPYNRNVTLQAFELFSAYARLYNAAASPASRLRSAGSLAINREWGHYREISDRGLDVLTERQRGQYIRTEVWDFPLMTERTWLISYLLYGLCSAILKKNTIKHQQK